MRKPPDHRVPRNPFAAAAMAPLVELDDAASDHRAVGLEPLPNGFETELIQSAERGQVKASEGSVVHVEVFRMGSVRTSILGRPRLLSRHRRAVSFYTLICEEPVYATGDCAAAQADADHLAMQACQQAVPLGKHVGHNGAADLLGLDPVEFAPDQYVTCLDLGPEDAVFTTG